MKKPDQGTATSFESISEWFKKAANTAKSQRRYDSAKLWEDGLDHLNYFKNKNEKLVEALKIISNRHDDHCDYWKFQIINNCKCSSSIAREALDQLEEKP